ncbi:MAG: phospholipid-binding protein, partial [Gemmata sp.]
KPQPAGDEVKSYWVVFNIPADATSLEKNSKGVGKAGYNDKRRTGYDPMNSKGPGPKEYHVTLFALSAEPKFDTDKVTRSDLLKAVKHITLAETTLSYTYERKTK